jgi:hypothetical protein
MVRDVEIDGGDVARHDRADRGGLSAARFFRAAGRRVLRDVPGVVERVALGFDVMTPEERQALTTKLRGGVQERSQGSRSTRRRACSRCAAARAVSASRR